ncbi:hypothetical protein MBAV_003115 [Candidatus Magnetobacterium bavaricum]|uniref:Uncharacterized protein n=1 Tax=Candidatus Magnetobacterium bavaricum TaxID=29290 RepID=A0A0F3GS84_9BACT|nr:hypothetical protein MBAV_003115 [Candidatus Magnetobacterium bavaricum]
MNKIKQWGIDKVQGSDKDINIKVGSYVRRIRPVVDKIVTNFALIDVIRYIKVMPEDLYASSEINVGRVKTPITKPHHPTAIGVSIMFFFEYKEVQFYEMNSPIKGYGSKMTDAVMSALPKGWKAFILMDWSGGFWRKMVKMYSNLKIM